jgi:hypothetical protein
MLDQFRKQCNFDREIQVKESIKERGRGGIKERQREIE